ncbi:probable beta-D-xylosidase 6 isoform X1 [Andrographis paniculata]|uniref:probable beta-D-xylosidase 6 isoform X1 n=1 Tax=Andrographis paniculata TaxID=175694 RepID=UPI0021E820B0|nr:probable beta-D-xylosidase 6 isoform X1 [Andrographis paniculata]
MLLISCCQCSVPADHQTPWLRYPCRLPNHSSYPFCNTSLPIEVRARSLVSLLTLDEKIQQLSNNASAIDRLGIPPYEWWSESLHGIASNGPGVSFNGTIKSATGFPQVLVAAASFNRTLWSAIASAIAVEAKAMHNYGQAGLTFWAPNINIFRDPRWGRGQETPGEDPMVVSAYAVAYVRAFQGQHNKADVRRRVLSESVDSDGLMLSACCKHYTAYDLEKWQQFTRYNFNAIVTNQDMADTYQVPFRSCIEEGRASCLMCSYNSVNGIPACANHGLLQKARKDWNFLGYITSDCDAVATIYEYQNFTKSPEDAVAAALRAGTDINCGTYMLRHMRSAIEKEKVSEGDVDEALVNLFSVQLRLGLFDGESRNRFGGLGPQDVCTAEHRKLALEAAKQGIVLLKNDENLLPLNKHRVSSLAVIGPMADSTDLGGGYTGVPCNPRSILDGLRDYVSDAKHAVGCRDTRCNSSAGFAEAVYVAKHVDYVIVVVGLNLTQETEDQDRYSLLLPGLQMALVTAIAEVSKKPLILVITGGGPVDVSFAAGHLRIGGILWIGYPGETGGEALAEIIFGRNNPGGRLPVTWYPESFVRVPMNDMNMRPDPSRNYPGRTHRFYTGDTVYGFGHGLSYTSFSYKLASSVPGKLQIKELSRRRSTLYDDLDYILIDEIRDCSLLKFEVQILVSNDGDVEGSEVVLLYTKMSKILRGSPRRQLIGFERVRVLPKRVVAASFNVDVCEHLSMADENGSRVMPLGDHILMSGNIEHIISIGF